MRFYHCTLIASSLLIPFLTLNTTLAQGTPPTTELVIESDKIFDPKILSLNSMAMYEKTFNFDWNNCATIVPNKSKIVEIDSFIRATDRREFQTLSAQDQEALGRMLYKMGTYYTHIDHHPDRAILYMDMASKLLRKSEEKSWNDNHLSYAYEQKFARSLESKDKKKADYYANKVLTQHKNQTKSVAFAYCMKGMLDGDSKDYTHAEQHFQKAINIYEHLPNGKDEQYARVKNRLAATLLAMNTRDDEALLMLQQVNQFWQHRNASQNPYAARNFLSLGEAYLKIGNTNEATAKLKRAIQIYQNVYGNNDEHLIKPYELLSFAYNKKGDEQLAKTYEQRALHLNKLMTSSR
ncbi:MAG: tetratricopeptide repeat protein [Gammaproteobacteria bacterium]|nr:tetratricopeptide repeat protein [Gammaproteobacteria bacterium]